MAYTRPQLLSVLGGKGPALLLEPTSWQHTTVICHYIKSSLLLGDKIYRVSAKVLGLTTPN